MSDECLWKIRPGACESFWAFTPCEPGFNPLTRAKNIDEVLKVYEGSECPICKKRVKIDLSWFDLEPEFIPVKPKYIPLKEE